MKKLARAALFLIPLGAVADPAGSQSLEVIGYAGVLGEWEVTAIVTEKASRRSKEYSGPLTMKHVGFCTQDGPEIRTGEIRFEILPSSPRLTATLLVAGVECTYRGRLSDSYTGKLYCPDRPAVPLELWVK